jgi:hypothetical protein
MHSFSLGHWRKCHFDLFAHIPFSGRESGDTQTPSPFSPSIAHHLNNKHKRLMIKTCTRKIVIKNSKDTYPQEGFSKHELQLLKVAQDLGQTAGVPFKIGPQVPPKHSRAE